MIKFCISHVFNPMFLFKQSLPLYLCSSNNINNNNDGTRIMKCYNCGAPGHRSSQCPEEPRCRICKKPGHVVANCPEKVNRDVRQVKCFNCNQTGHMSRECPHERKVRNTNFDGTERRQRRCFICQDPGHIAPNCPQKGTRPQGQRRDYQQGQRKPYQQGQRNYTRQPNSRPAQKRDQPDEE